MKTTTPLERVLREAAPLTIAAAYFLMALALLCSTESVPVLATFC